MSSISNGSSLRTTTPPFRNVLSESMVTRTLATVGVLWIDRIYSPPVTLRVILGQVLSADHSYRSAVARLIAHRMSRGKNPAPQKPALIAKRGSGCPRRSSPPWRVRPVATGTPKPNPGGYGMAGTFTCSTARPSPCPTPRTIRTPTRRSIPRSRESSS
jgi:hypothetical protein